ncbi:MAG: DUF58 domain-containing protein [Trueperaceae bacterium]|jgi:uncharacterized protein (DUF58 family)
MLAPRTRALLDRYGLASRALSRVGGERSATEPGQSVEFHDYRAYQPGDELRYVDWRVYARTGRLYTRLYQAERSVRLHLVLDNSASMSLYGKDAYARTLVQLLTYVSQRDAPTQLHLLDGRASRPAQGLGGLLESLRFVDEAGTARPAGAGAGTEGASLLPVTALKRFALTLPALRGSSLVLVVSDLLEETSLRPTLAALRARGVDVGFLQVVAEEELSPPVALLELFDVESSEKLPVGAAEVEAYRAEVRAFLARTRAAILKAGYKHALMKAPLAGQDVERAALAALIRAGILIKR